MVRPDFDQFTAVAGVITTKQIRLERIKLTHVSTFIVPRSSNPNASMGIRLNLVAVNGKGLFTLLPEGTIIHKTNNSRIIKSWEGEFTIDEIAYDLEVVMINEHTANIQIAVNWHGVDL